LNLTNIFFLINWLIVVHLWLLATALNIVPGVVILVTDIL